jgi:hypothetical protein
VFFQPVCFQPMFLQPVVFFQPVFSQPVSLQPVFQPVCRGAACRQPPLSPRLFPHWSPPYSTLCSLPLSPLWQPTALLRHRHPCQHPCLHPCHQACKWEGCQQCCWVGGQPVQVHRLSSTRPSASQQRVVQHSGGEGGGGRSEDGGEHGVTTCGRGCGRLGCFLDVRVQTRLDSEQLL